jgi:glycosyltransferase involved in cell wall biosynthesis
VPRLAQFLRQCAPDVVYLMYLGWTYNFQFMSTFLPTIVKRVLPGVTVVTRFENVGGAGPQANSFASRTVRKLLATLDSQGDVDYQFGTLLRDSDAVILLSSRHEAFLERHRPGVGRKCVLIPPPSNMRMSLLPEDLARERGRAMLGLDADQVLVAYIGFIYPGKGIETLLHAFRRLSLDRDRIRLAVIGGSLAREFPDHPSYLEGLQALCRELGIAARVTWTGEYTAESDEASLYLRAADVCALPFETGVKLNNSSFSSAAAHGLPIVTTFDEQLEPQFENGENVILCQPGSPEALALAIERVMDDEPLRQRLARGSLLLAERWYSWQTATDRTLALLAAPEATQEKAGAGGAEQLAGRRP